ncbi:ABC-2 transporter permease [Saccharibacillus sp. CPCC 101409]|uniref:ABC-2 transporter permease n=1 Tax=Saccharibacillus sp. CPCC 101409 TaxID=3058041 RepID=UPI0026718DC9|nr:ABC-2 transporter permease [Saccharibacillus sp. CPCC 101409]MDO3411829.1 ABC-2 transporter permease [Saccharibacillus sp. CPCC 101409]
MSNIAYLIRKDILLVYRYMLVLIPLLGYMAFLQTGGFMYYAVLPSAMMLITACTLEIQPANQRFIASLPVSRRRIVLARYASVLPYTLIGIALGLMMKIVAELLGQPISAVHWQESVAVLGINLLLASVFLPLYYWLGPKGMQAVRLAFIVLVIVGSTTFGYLLKDSLTMQRWINDGVWRAAPGLLIAMLSIVLLLILSLLLSWRLYERRDV